MFRLYSNPDLDDWIFYCLLTSTADMQAEDVRASFLFVGDINSHHQEWLGFTTKNRHDVAAFEFMTVSGCDQLVASPTYARGGTLDILLTHVPDLVYFAFVAPTGNTDHPSLSVVILMVTVFQTRVLVGKFSLDIKSIGIQFLVQYRICLGANIWSADNPFKVLKEHETFFPAGWTLCTTKFILLLKKDEPWFDDQCMHAFGLK